MKPAWAALPCGVVTATLSLVEPAGTVAVIEVAVFAVIVALGPPPNFNEVAPLKFVPVIVTEPPAPWEIGAKLVIAGAGTNVKPADVTVPPAVVTEQPVVKTLN